MTSPSASSGVFPPPTPPVTVLIADAHPVVRIGLTCLLGECPALGVVGDGPCEIEAAAELAARLNPDVVVVGGPAAAAVTARLRQANAARRVLVLSACPDAAEVRRALAAGAGGYVLKRAAADELVRAVRAVAAGGTYLDPAVAGLVVGDPAPADGGGLSEREVQVLKLIALGYSNKEIAARLRVSVKTVETYKARASEKLGLHSRVDLVRHAVRCGWVGEGEPAGGHPSAP